MKIITFYQWLINTGANTQNTPGEKCLECEDRGFNDARWTKWYDEYTKGDAIICDECGNDEKLMKLRKEYHEQKQKDEKLMAQPSKTAVTIKEGEER